MDRNNRAETFCMRLTPQEMSALRMAAVSAGYKSTSKFVRDRCGLDQQMASDAGANGILLCRDEGKLTARTFMLSNRNLQFLEQLKQIYGDLSLSEIMRKIIDERMADSVKNGEINVM